MARSITTGRFVRTESALAEVAERIIAEMVSEIRSNRKVVTGDLASSFNYSIDELELNIESDVEYAGVQDRGYSGPMPPVGKIKRWAQLRGLRPRHLTGKKAGKFMSLDQFAFLAARSIGRYGYSGIDYVANAFLRTSDLIDRAIGEAYAQDIEEMLEQNITFK